MTKQSIYTSLLRGLQRVKLYSFYSKMSAMTEIGSDRNNKARLVSQFPWSPAFTTNHVNSHNETQIILKFTDPQPGGVKIGQVAKILREAHTISDLVADIDEFSRERSCVGIFFNNFDGDVIANWGKPGAAGAWEAYLRGFSNLYCGSGTEAKSSGSRILGDQIIFTGMLNRDDLQQQCLKLVQNQREVATNIKLCELVSEHSTSLSNILNAIVRSKLNTLFLLSGGDNAIYACAKAVKRSDNEVVLLRIDRHMDERDLTLRSDPRVNSKTYPHSGNGVTQAKSEHLINYDFLLGCDFERNNNQCKSNSDQYRDRCFTKISPIEKIRFDPKATIDRVMDDVCSLMERNENIDLVVNIDCDTFNNIPSSAETFTGGLDPVWAYYILEKLAILPRPPRIIRIAELQYSGDERRKAIAEDFATEILRSGILTVQKFM
eukprot:Seg943.3 transcript_id=Seg943.3/GoldUCD/mRNA.D3Y31 product="hypothetical protein" protein_id=Seg943.3/GoldUCD/D3Y31